MDTSPASPPSQHRSGARRDEFKPPVWSRRQRPALFIDLGRCDGDDLPSYFIEPLMDVVQEAYRYLYAAPDDTCRRVKEYSRAQ